MPYVPPLRCEVVLEDGTRFGGVRFGAPSTVGGEVVFATGMSGYVETLTDPSYKGQIVVLTYPQQGNYGVAAIADSAFESSRIQAQGLVVSAATTCPSHHGSARSLGAWLSDEGVPGVEQLDTRALTKRLREHGTMRGWIVDAGLNGPALEWAKREAAEVRVDELARRVAPTTPTFHEGGPRTVLLVDAGCKENIVRQLVSRRLSVLRVPFHANLQDLLHQRRVDGIVLGNGPGDPKNLPEYVLQTRELLGAAVPIFGICLGVQVLALAAGADTYKLQYGHRSQNQPVRDLTSGHCYITSQNHGYAVRHDHLPLNWDTWFENINDGTCEGIRHASLPIAGVQFHPEGAPGPEDTRWLFDHYAARLAATPTTEHVGRRAWP